MEKEPVGTLRQSTRATVIMINKTPWGVDLFSLGVTEMIAKNQEKAYLTYGIWMTQEMMSAQH